MKPITEKEKKILTLISEGFSTYQIGYALDISTHTVETHRKNLLAKFGAKNSPELVRIAIQANVLPGHSNKTTYNLNPNPHEDEG